MDDSEDYEFEVGECFSEKWEKCLRLVIINPTMEEVDGELRIGIVTGKEGAETIVDALCQQIEEIWG